ncbi:MAG: phosphotransferase [Deltaproteobacteria bacterium]|jgi:phosphate uptake regulator|nr:phosphotransferase [Deltaproteobacteria bacterium]
MLDTIKGGFRVLVNETLYAATETRQLLKKRDPGESRVLYHRTLFINTQVALLQKQTMELFLGKTAGYKESLFLFGISSIASRLERICDILINLDRQAGYLSDLKFLAPFSPDEYFEVVIDGVKKIVPALERREVSLAIQMGQVEEKLDALYAGGFEKIISELSMGSGNHGDLVTSLMIIHYLERLGDLLLEIGEKIIYVILGEKIKLEQYKALGAGLKASGREMELGKTGFKSIWGGRSGCRIGVVGNARFPREGEADVYDSEDRDHGDISDVRETVLFKHGPGFKLSREKEKLELWNALRPGLTPEVKAFIPADSHREATLILEYVPARNLQTLFMENVPKDAYRGLELSLKIMADIWTETKREQPSSAEFMRQAESRLTESEFLYPELVKDHCSIGSLEAPPFSRLISSLKPVELMAPCPNSMRIHGDFNLSNILFDENSGEIRVLDLHRSRENDYVQDVSVMLVSILRLPVFKADARKRLNLAARNTYLFALDFARSLNDRTFETRLAFGLARSFLSSIRVVLEEKLARKFVERSRYLMEKIFHHAREGKALEDFRLNEEILRIDSD